MRTKRTEFFFVSFLFMILSASGLQAQEKRLSLEDCINYALDHNIDIKKQVLAVEAYKADLLQSKLGMLPSLNAGATHGYNWGQTIDRYTNSFATERVQSNNFYLATDVSLFSGLQQVNTVKQNKLELMASEYDLDLMMDNISIAVAGYYLDILYNEELLAVAGDQLAITQQQVNRMKKMVDAGTMAKGDLLNLEAQAAAEELAVVQAENALNISYLSLMQLIDYPVSEEFAIVKPELKPIEAPQVSVNAEDVFNTALNLRPDIKSAELRVRSAEKSLDISRGYLSPTISFSGSWATGFSGAAKENVEPYDVIPFNTQLNDNNNKTINLSLQIPLFNGYQARTAISKSKLLRETAQNDLQQTKLNLNKTIQQAYADAVSALNNYNASEKKVEAQTEAFKYSQQKFDVGMLTSVEYNTTKKDLATAESQLLQAKYRFIYTTTVLDFYMGKPLSLK